MLTRPPVIRRFPRDFQAFSTIVPAKATVASPCEKLRGIAVVTRVSGNYPGTSWERQNDHSNEMGDGYDVAQRTIPAPLLFLVKSKRGDDELHLGDVGRDLLCGASVRAGEGTTMRLVPESHPCYGLFSHWPMSRQNLSASRDIGQWENRP
jgi:hypothetical protein